jgi:hypothetical protein
MSHIYRPFTPSDSFKSYPLENTYITDIVERIITLFGSCGLAPHSNDAVSNNTQASVLYQSTNDLAISATHACVAEAIGNSPERAVTISAKLRHIEKKFDDLKSKEELDQTKKEDRKKSCPDSDKKHSPVFTEVVALLQSLDENYYSYCDNEANEPDCFKLLKAVYNLIQSVEIDIIDHIDSTIIVRCAIDSYHTYVMSHDSRETLSMFATNVSDDGDVFLFTIPVPRPVRHTHTRLVDTLEVLTLNPKKPNKPRADGVDRRTNCYNATDAAARTILGIVNILSKSN